jgi:hypothetical protein
MTSHDDAAVCFVATPCFTFLRSLDDKPTNTYTHTNVQRQYLCYSIFLSGLVYPVVAHAIWSNNGFFSSSNIEPFLGCGVFDFAGSGVVHITGGTTALYATMILGPRRGRFYDSHGEPLDVPKEFPGHSVALQLLGTMILWFGCKKRKKEKGGWCEILYSWPACSFCALFALLVGRRLRLIVLFFDRLFLGFHAQTHTHTQQGLDLIPDPPWCYPWSMSDV